MKASTSLALASVLLLLFFVHGLLFIRSHSQTFDEAAHLAAGYSYLATRDFRLNPEHPPLVKSLQALPIFLLHGLDFHPDPHLWQHRDAFRIGYDFLYNSKLPADLTLSLGRSTNLVLGGILIGLIGWWAYRLWGSSAAVLAMTLASLEPNLIAHSSLATTDTGVALFVFAAVYCLWEYMRRSSWTLLTVTGVLTGLAHVTKFSALLLIPILFLLLVSLVASGEHVRFPPSNSRFNRRAAITQAAAVFIFILALAGFVIPPAYAFEGYSQWIYGLRTLFALTEGGRPSFFLGQYSHEGWWHYFLVAFLIKTPIGSLTLMLASLVLYRAGMPLTRREAIFVCLPPLLIFAITTQSGVNIGLRHILPVYPFLFVLASRSATIDSAHARLGRYLIWGAVLLNAVSVLRIAPHQLAYFNEFVGGADQGYRYLSDSNLDWGQDLKGVKAYMDEKEIATIYLSYFGAASPSYYGIRYQYVPPGYSLEWPPPSDKVPESELRKILVISVFNLQDVYHPDNPLFRWLWRREPIAKIGYSIFVYDLSNDPDGLARLKETYIKAGATLP